MVVPAQKLAHEQWDVFPTVPERGHDNPEHVKSVEQVFPESALHYRVTQVPVRRSNNPDVRLDRALPAQAVEPLLVNQAQQADLHPLINRADLVEENGAAVAQLKLALASLLRAGEGALLMAEEIAGHEFRWKGAQVDGDVTPIAAITFLVNRLGAQVLAGPGLAEEKNRHGGRGGLADLPVHVLHWPRSADDLFELRQPPLLQQLVLTIPGLVVQRALDQKPQLIVAHGNRGVLVGAGLEDGPGHADVSRLSQK